MSSGHFHHLIAAGRPLQSSLAPVKSKTFDIPAPADPVVVELWPLNEAGIDSDKT